MLPDHQGISAHAQTMVTPDQLVKLQPVTPTHVLMEPRVHQALHPQDILVVVLLDTLDLLAP